MIEKYLRIIEANKRLVFLLFILMVLLFAGVVTTARVIKLESLKEEKFPASILTDDIVNKPSFQAPSYDGVTVSCPNMPYEIVVPGEILKDSADKLVSCYQESYFTLYVAEEELASALNGRFGSYFIDSIDTPKSSFEVSVSDTGYLNGYAAEYQTGLLTISTKLDTQKYYIASYRLAVEPENYLLLLVACDTLEKLSESKTTLDEMIMTLVPYKETENEDKVPEDESSENNQTGLIKGESDEQVIQENGMTYYTKDFTVYVGKEYRDGVYIIFKWVNFLEKPVEMTVISPSGEEYQKNEELSEDGEWVFIIPDNEVGIYTIHGEAINTIYVNYYEALSKKDYFATYKNLDIITGEPVRSFKEEKK